MEFTENGNKIVDVKKDGSESIEDNKNEKNKKRMERIDNELKYKSIYLNNNYTNATPNTKNSCAMELIDNFLEKEKETNKSQPWNKLNKKNKVEKIIHYCNVFSEENSFSESNNEELQRYLLKALDNKKFTKIKDINYNKEDGVIKDIPGLFFDKKKKIFTIKNQDNRVSTSKNLAPKTKKSKILSKKNKSRENKKD
uniref:Uncharacterized protein n=1 Tax=viral metagenome TaxID=1070528 RepID=A0A6C0BRK9_9ZZZZ